jgi:hypothetical protein
MYNLPINVMEIDMKQIKSTFVKFCPFLQEWQYIGLPADGSPDIVIASKPSKAEMMVVAEALDLVNRSIAEAAVKVANRPTTAPSLDYDALVAKYSANHAAIFGHAPTADVMASLVTEDDVHDAIDNLHTYCVDNEHALLGREPD